jgi:thioredoxin-like negative regulator of GroEL
MWCKALEESTYTDATFQDFSKRFTLVKVNAEVDTAVAARYRVKSYPTVLVLKQDGTEIDRIVGYYRAPEFIAHVEDYLAGRNTLASMIQEEATKGQDAAFASKLADKYFEHGLYDEARSRYERTVALDPENKTGVVDDALLSLARMERKENDLPGYRRYAQMVVDRYPESDMGRTARIHVALSYKREGNLAKARELFLDYAKRFPGDEDAPYAQEQADTLAVKIAQEQAGKTGA